MNLSSHRGQHLVDLGNHRGQIGIGGEQFNCVRVRARGGHGIAQLLQRDFAGGAVIAVQAEPGVGRGVGIVAVRGGGITVVELSGRASVPGIAFYPSCDSFQRALTGGQCRFSVTGEDWLPVLAIVRLFLM